MVETPETTDTKETPDQKFLSNLNELQKLVDGYTVKTSTFTHTVNHVDDNDDITSTKKYTADFRSAYPVTINNPAYKEWLLMVCKTPKGYAMSLQKFKEEDVTKEEDANWNTTKHYKPSATDTIFFTLEGDKLVPDVYIRNKSGAGAVIFYNPDKYPNATDKWEDAPKTSLVKIFMDKADDANSRAQSYKEEQAEIQRAKNEKTSKEEQEKREKIEQQTREAEGVWMIDTSTPEWNTRT